MDSKLKRKRSKTNEFDLPSKQVKYTSNHHSDKPQPQSIDSTNEDEPSDAVPALTNEQAQLLDSVRGHLKELTHVNDPIDDGGDDQSKVLSKSAARRLKKKQNGQSKCEPLVDETSCVASQEAALEYLRLWSEERERWSFKKKIQFWLLQNMYHKSKVPKKNFKVLLSYLEGLQGHQKQLVVDKARRILDQYSEDQQSEDSPTKREYKRAVSILRVLA